MFDETDKLISLNQFVIFSVGSGGFGGKKTSEHQRPVLPAPKRKPDQICRETTNIDQAALYRLTGDANPLHIDPSFAAAAGKLLHLCLFLNQCFSLIEGFERPILHGLCSFGHATRHILHTYANDDPALFKAVKVISFSLPTQLLEKEMFRFASLNRSNQVKPSKHTCGAKATESSSSRK